MLIIKDLLTSKGLLHGLYQSGIGLMEFNKGLIIELNLRWNWAHARRFGRHVPSTNLTRKPFVSVIFIHVCDEGAASLNITNHVI